MSSGKSCAEITVLRKSKNFRYGVARPTLDANQKYAWASRQFWGIGAYSGAAAHAGNTYQWTGQEGLENGDVVRLLLDSDSGSLTVKKNGTLLGVAVPQGLTGDLCWAVAVYTASHVYIKAVDPAEF